MAENVLLNLGIGLDSEQAEVDASRVMKELSDVLGKTLDIDVDPTDIEKLGQILKNANGQISIVKDNITGLAKSINASWEDANGQIIKYTQNLKTLNRFNFDGVDLSKLDQETIDAYNSEGRMYDVESSKYSIQNNDYIKESISYIKEYYDIKTKLINLDPKKDSLWAEYLNKELDSLEPKITKIKESLLNSNNYDFSGLKSLTNSIEEGEKKLSSSYDKKMDKESYSEYSEAIKTASKAIDDLYDAQSKLIKNKYSPESNTYKTLSDNVESAKQKLDEAVISLQKFDQAQDFSLNDSVANGIHTITSEYQGQEEALKKLNEQLEIKNKKQVLSNAQKQDELIDESKIESATNALKLLISAKEEYYKKKFSGLSNEELEEQIQFIKILEQELQKLEQTQLSTNNTVGQDINYRRTQKEAYNELSRSIKKMESESNSANGSFKNLDNSISSNLANVIAMSISYQTLEQAMTKIIDTAKELDAAMTDIQIVTQMSTSDAMDLMQSYSQIAKELGTTTTAVAASSSEWLRQGETVEETSELVKASTTLATVGAMDSAEATTALTAAINGYQMQASDAMAIVDQLTTLDLRFAASAGGIATALSKVASVASQSGVGLEKLESILTVTQDQTQQSAETIGNA